MQLFSLGSYLRIKPFGHNQRSLTVSRTRIAIELRSNHEVNVSSKEIVLPCLPGDESTYELILTNDKNFVLRALNNGKMTGRGLDIDSLKIRGGERIYLGSNELVFQNENCQNDNVIEMEKLHLYGKTNLPLLIQGKTGTGKSTMARRVHEQSGNNSPFVQVNLSSLSSELIESELFGHAKGAFTGAISDKIGYIQECGNGTLFLDEIDSLPLSKQVKLLQVLEERTYRPVGSLCEKKVNCRFIFASGRDLAKLVRLGTMRQDFYFRLSSGHVHYLKSLEEEPSLIDSCLDEFSIKSGVFISKRLREFYRSYSWPGNFRQLKGHLCKKLESGGCFSDCDEFDRNLPEIEKSVVFEHYYEIKELESVKKDYIKAAYWKLGSDYSKVASTLKISPNTLRKYLAMPQ